MNNDNPRNISKMPFNIAKTPLIGKRKLGNSLKIIPITPNNKSPNAAKAQSNSIAILSFGRQREIAPQIHMNSNTQLNDFFRPILLIYFIILFFPDII
jgi:hypothetical protein